MYVAADMLLKANSQRQTRDGKKVIIAVAVSTDVIHHQHHQQVSSVYADTVVVNFIDGFGSKLGTFVTECKTVLKMQQYCISSDQ